MSFEIGQEIFIKNKKEADIIYGLLRKEGYCWNSGKTYFDYYNLLPIVVRINSYKKLSYCKVYTKEKWMLSIDDFIKNKYLDLE